MTKNYELKRGKTPDFRIDYDRELNPQQRAAVLAPEGPVMVIAGAGSGKTRVVTYRVAQQLERGLRPDEILLLTFTEKASGEMLRRVSALARMDVNRIWGGTYHHVGNLILRRHAELLGFQKNYTILDRDDARLLLETCIREEKIDVKAHRFPRGKVLQEVFGYARSTDSTLEEAVEVKCEYLREQLERMEKVIRRYEAKKKKLNYFDFEDLLLQFYHLLERHPEIADGYARRFRQILVDEYQDTNVIQARIVDRLAKAHRNIMVVGDDAQSIYSFRGAAHQNIHDFPVRYPGCRVYTVETNYRSTPEILALTNQVFKGDREAFQKNLRAVRKSGPRPSLLRPMNVYEQAEFVAQRLEELQDEGTSLGEIAVLYRSHYHSMELQMELARREIPYVVRSGLRYFEQAHIKDILSYLKVLANPHDELAWKRILAELPRVAPRTAEKVWNALAAAPRPWELLEKPELEKILQPGARKGWGDFLDTWRRLRRGLSSGPAELIMLAQEGQYQNYLKTRYSNYRNRLEDLKQLANYAARYDELNTFLAEIAMLGGVVAEDVYAVPQEEMVVLSSIHQAKGLEWKAVFLLWLVEGRFPPASSYTDPANLEEEKRLFYVAVTRCRDELYLLQPLSARRRSGMEVLLQPSRFLDNLDPRFYELWNLA